jgi:hypothetical protein
MRLDHLVLIRLATIKSLAPSALATQLRPLVATDDFKRQLDETLRTLAVDGWVVLRPPRITDRAAEVLGVDAIPSWRQLRSRHLPGLALGIPVKSAADLKAAIVAQLLVKHLGLSPRSTDPHQIINLAVTTAMRVPRADAQTLQAELVKRWVADASAAAVATSPPPTRVKPVPAPTVWTDDDVIKAVRDATSQVPAAGRFGGDRVFVSAIWRQLGEETRFPGLTLDGLKDRLIAANRRQQVTLARADMPGAMDQREVAASEIRYLNSTFHFVLDHSRS